MHDLLEYKDKYHRCRRFIAVAVIVFALSCGALGYMWPEPCSKSQHTSPLAWQHFLKLIENGNFIPVKMTLNAIEFRRNSIYLTGSSMWQLNKDMLTKDNWHLKKFANYAVEISRNLT